MRNLLIPLALAACTGCASVAPPTVSDVQSRLDQELWATITAPLGPFATLSEGHQAECMRNPIVANRLVCLRGERDLDKKMLAFEELIRQVQHESDITVRNKLTEEAILALKRYRATREQWIEDNFVILIDPPDGEETDPSAGPAAPLPSFTFKPPGFDI